MVRTGEVRSWCPNSHGMRNEIHIGMKCLHWLIQRSRMFLAGDQKYLCLKKFGELRKMLTSHITDELHLVAQPVGLTKNRIWLGEHMTQPLVSLRVRKMSLILAFVSFASSVEQRFMAFHT